METITLSEKEYKILVSKSQAYDKLAAVFYSSIIKGSIDDIVEDFKETGIYEEKFIEDLKNGLYKSSFIKSNP